MMVSDKLQEAANRVYVTPEDLHANNRSHDKSWEFHKTVTLAIPRIAALEECRRLLEKHQYVDGYCIDDDCPGTLRTHHVPQCEIAVALEASHDPATH